MSDVGSWSPPTNALGDRHREMLQHLAWGASADANGDPITLAVEEADMEPLREFMTAPPDVLATFIADATSKELTLWIRFATLAERLPGGEVGAKSPVIVMARELKVRGDYPETLTKWIKAHTRNRFLPHGNLMDRL